MILAPRPFKLYNSWMLKDGFEEVIRKACYEFVGFETPDAYLPNKLKHVKKAIRCWRTNAVKDENKDLDSLKKKKG